MSIFNNSPSSRKNNSTIGFYFGHTEAEGENKRGIQNLDHYFEDYLGVLPQIQNEKFLFIGRKGVGKSAIAKYISDKCTDSQNSFAEIIRFNDIELETIIQNIPESDRANIELIIFEWLILVRLIRLFVLNESAQYISQFKKFRDFLSRNSGFIEIDAHHITEIIEKKKFEINFDVLKHIFSTVIGKYFDVKKTKAPFYQFVNPLREIIQEVIKFDVFNTKEFFILFDDLDIKFKTDLPESNEKLLALIRTVKNLNTTIFRGTGVKIIVFLRDDIKKALETKDSDTSKLFSSYSINLNWYDHNNFKIDENLVVLKQLANKRIKLNFESNSIQFDSHDPWHSLFKNENYNNSYQFKSSFKYFIDFTFYRPRDIILFLSEIGNNDYKYPLESKTVRGLIQKFIHSNIKELKSELAIHFTENEVRNLFLALKRLSALTYTITKDNVISYIEEFLPQKDAHNVLELLLDYSILVLKDSGEKLYFNYRDNDLETIDFGNMNLTLHKSIYKYFNPEN